MQATGSSLPEFDADRRETEAAPVGRDGHVVAWLFGGQRGEFLPVCQCQPAGGDPPVAGHGVEPVAG